MSIEVLAGLGTRAKVLPPVGRCIYCGASENLSEEHIIPFALGGNIILPEASCPRCAKETGAIVEQKLLNTTVGPFGNARLRLDLPTRRPKSRPATKALFVTSSEGKSRRVDVPVDRLPLMIPSITTDPSRPWILLADHERPSVPQCNLWVKVDEDALKPFALPGETMELVRIDPVLVARFIAKIAHSAAMSEAAFRDCLEPYLPDLILGRSDRVFQFIGARANETGDTMGLHNLNFGWREGRPRYLIAYVRLFCMYGTPDFEVVVGHDRTV